ncbi:MAG: fibronectin type III domain-containing protein [Armatimonadota bacterium]|nr:fibronectin type III domain-containing protein [Armatimonadota bacterium]
MPDMEATGATFDMVRRIHCYSNESLFDFEFDYWRDDVWTSLKDRVLSKEPITVSKRYREIYNCGLRLNNEDGLLTPENLASPYNRNSLNDVDELLDGARKVRLKQGVYCYGVLSYLSTVTADVAITGGNLTTLTDLAYGDATNAADAEWVYWSSVAADDTIALTLDLGASQLVRHGVISFMSKSNASPQIMLPSLVAFEYSADNVTFYPVSPDDFDMSEYNDSRSGQRFLAHFNDLSKNARYIRATITNIDEVNEIYVDEFCCWGGTTTTLRTKTTLTGYLGDAITGDTSAAVIDLNWLDVRKKEQDHQHVELTMVYKNYRPEEIIYDLLTNAKYWSSSGAYYGFGPTGSNLFTNGDFEAGITGWTPSGGASLKATWQYGGTGYCVELDYGGEQVRQTVGLTAGKTYILMFRYYAPAAAKFHVNIVPNGGNPEMRYPASGSVDVGPESGYLLHTVIFTLPTGSTEADIRVRQDKSYSNDFRVDDFWLREYVAGPAESVFGYDAPLTAAEIGWALVDNLSGFTIPKWQGKQGTILDYINELAKLVGWVYDCDGDGVRQFWEPEYNRLTASDYQNYFGVRWGKRSTAIRRRSDKDIRNAITVVGVEKGNKQVPRLYIHLASIDRYGIRYAKIIEPLCRTAELSDKLGRALLRDFAYAGRTLEAESRGDFDVDRPYRIMTFHEPIRACLTKEELWANMQYDTSMVASGDGDYTASLILKKYFGSQPTPVANVIGTGASGQITVGWTVSPEADIAGYYVYWASGDDPDVWDSVAFLKRERRTIVASPTDTITGLVNGTAYWFYVRAVNLAGILSERSAIVRCLAGAGNSGSEAGTWGITGLAVALTDNDPSVAADLSWTPSLVVDPDYIVVTLFGPETANPPVVAGEHAKLTPANSIVEHYYSSYKKSDLVSSTTYRWRVAITEVVINDTHYHFGSPLYSNVASGVWP